MCLGALPIYIRGLSFILFISYASLLYQFSDLSLLDPPLQSNAYSSYRFIFFLYSIFDYFSYPILLSLGLFSSLFLFFLWVPFWMLLFNGLLYLSLFVLFPTFMSFQWDILLVEALFFSLILFSPRLIRLRPSIEHLRPLLVLLPLILLMVRLFYHSGVVKLLSNDPLWLGQFVWIFIYFLNPCLIFYLFICISLSF